MLRVPMKMKKFLMIIPLLCASLSALAAPPPAPRDAPANSYRAEWEAIRFEYLNTDAIITLCQLFFRKSFTDQWIQDRFGPIDVNFNIVRYEKMRDPALRGIELEYWRYQPSDARRFIGLDLTFRKPVPVNIQSLKQFFGKYLVIPRLSPSSSYLYQFAMKNSEYRDSRVILSTVKPIEFTENFLTEINFRHE